MACLRRSFWVLMLPCLALAAVGTSASAEILRYVDDQGGTHYSDRYESIPPQYRDQVSEVSAEIGKIGSFGIDQEGSGQTAPAEAADSAFSLETLSGDLAVSGVAETLRGAFGWGLIVVVLLLVPVFAVIGGLILKLACRLAGADPPSLGRACLILLAQSITGSVLGGLVNSISLGGEDGEAGLGASIALAGGSVVLSWLAGAAVLNAMTSYGMPRSLWIGVVHALLTLVLMLGPIAAILGFMWLRS